MERTTEASGAAGREPFTVEEGLARGMTRKQLRSRHLRSPTRGVRVATTEPDTVELRCAAVALRLPSGAAFSHATALRLAGIDAPFGLRSPDALHVTVPRLADRPTRHAVVAHWTGRTLQVSSIGGLPVTAAAQTWSTLAAELSPDETVVLADALLRRKDPRCTVGELREVVRACPAGTRGIRTMRRALELMRTGTDSCMETRARLTLVLAGLPCPEVNAPALDARGRFVALPDLSYPGLKIAIEYDGDIHRTDAGTWRRDIERRQRLEDAGWLVITATADDVLHLPDRFVRRVSRAIRTRSRDQ